MISDYVVVDCLEYNENVLGVKLPRHLNRKHSRSNDHRKYIVQNQACLKSSKTNPEGRKMAAFSIGNKPIYFPRATDNFCSFKYYGLILSSDSQPYTMDIFSC